MRSPAPPIPRGAPRAERSAEGKRAEGGFGLAVWATWLFVVVAVGRLGEIVPGLGNIPIAKAAVGIALLCILASRSTLSTAKLLQSPLARNALALFCLAILLVPASIAVGGSASFLLKVGLVLLVGFIFVFKIGRNWTVVRGTLMALVVSSAVLAAAAIATSAGGRVAAGTSYDTNDLAFVLVTILPIALAFAFAAEGRRRLILLGVCGLMVLTSLLTQSRGGLLGLAAIAMFMVFRPPFTLGARSKGWLGRSLLIALVAALAWTGLPQDTKDRFGTMLNLSSDYNMDAENTTGRTDIWKRNLKAAVDRPIGFGVNTFATVDFMTGGKYKAPHNSLVQVFVELGFVGLILFLRQYLLAWRALGRSAAVTVPGIDEKQARERVLLCQSLQVALVANFVTSFFLSQAYSNLIWILFATIAALTALDNNAGAADDQPPAGRRNNRSAKMRRRTNGV